MTSASSKEEALSNAGAALFVVTREDIASSGANSIPNLTPTVIELACSRHEDLTQALSPIACPRLFVATRPRRSIPPQCPKQ